MWAISKVQRSRRAFRDHTWGAFLISAVVCFLVVPFFGCSSSGLVFRRAFFEAIVKLLDQAVCVGVDPLVEPLCSARLNG